jgi:hypothetical protein
MPSGRPAGISFVVTCRVARPRARLRLPTQRVRPADQTRPTIFALAGALRHRDMNVRVRALTCRRETCASRGAGSPVRQDEGRDRGRTQQGSINRKASAAHCSTHTQRAVRPPECRSHHSTRGPIPSTRVIPSSSRTESAAHVVIIDVSLAAHPPKSSSASRIVVA